MQNKKLYATIAITILLIIGYFSFRTVKENPIVTGEIPATTTEPTVSTTPKENTLLGTSWVWVKSTDPLESSTDDILAPEGKFVLTFNQDMTLTSTSDCNSIGGNFVVDGEVLSIGSLVATEMACANSTEGFYTKQLGRVASHVINGDELTLILIKDSGTMTFKAIAR